MAANLHLNYPIHFSQPFSSVVPPVWIVGSFFFWDLPSAKPSFVPLWPHLLAQPFHPGVLHILLILPVNGRGSERSTRQKEMMAFQPLCLLRAASWKLFAEVNHSGNSLQFQDLKLAETSLILMKLLQIHSDIVKAKFGLKTVNLSNDEWILLCGYMAVNQSAISALQKTGFEIL